jgi:energy-converting hydrogenase A subunit R
MMACQFNTDCEGPISKNDNAMELSEFFIPGGHHFFSIVSKYDDYLADIERRSGYKAGDTLKLILPFLKAFGATDERMRQFSREHILLVPGAKEALLDISAMMETFIISTSYESYIDALCDVVRFPKDRTFSTQISLDRYFLKDEERKRLIHFAKEIQEMDMIEWPEDAKGLEALSYRDQKAIRRLDEIFWGQIREMAIGKILSEVNPIGGKEKAHAVLLSLERTGNNLKEVIYVGDSITDVDAFDLVRRGGGITLSFNGNRYALRSAEIACLSAHALMLTILAHVYQKEGREVLMEMVDQWGPGTLTSFGFDPELTQRLTSLSCSDASEGYPKVYRITDENRAMVIQESEAFRKKVRGVKFGSLG